VIARANRFMLFLVLFIMAFGTAFFCAVSFIEAKYDVTVNIQIYRAVSNCVSFAAPCALYMAAARLNFFKTVPFKIPEPANLLLIICASVLAAPTLMLISAVTSLVFTNNAAAYLEELGDAPIAAALSAAALTPAVFEEIAFRGVMLSELKHAGIKKAALMSGFFFGLIHMDLQQFPYAFLMGILFAYLVYYTRSVLASILSHFTLNAASVAVAYAYGPDGSSFPLIPALAVSLPALVFTVRLFVSYNKKNVVEESAIGDGAAPEKVFTWEFWAVIALYIIAVAAFH